MAYTRTWFKHDDDSATDEKLIELRIKHGPAGYGVWWLAVEYMHKHGGRIESVDRFAFTYNLDVAFAKQLLDTCSSNGLVTPDGDGGFSSSRVRNQLEERARVVSARAEAGRAGGLSKAKTVANAKQMPSKTVADKIREDKIREESPVENSTVTTEPKRDRASDEEVAPQFFKMIEANRWCDKAYADSKQKQFQELRGDTRATVIKKMRVAINSWHSPSERTKQLAKKIYHETAGLIQDKATDAKTLSSKALAERRAFSLAESGQVVE